MGIAYFTIRIVNLDIQNIVKYSLTISIEILRQYICLKRVSNKAVSLRYARRMFIIAFFIKEEN